MHKKLLLLLPLLTALVACSKDFEGEEIFPEQEVIDESGSFASIDETNSTENETLDLRDANLDNAFASFKSQGVPEIPLKQTLEFYRNNRTSVGGLQDSSCLIKPMSETGEIEKNSNRYDPTTVAMLKTGIRNERYIMIVDYTQPNTAKRGYLLDMKPVNGKFTLKTMTISHGYGSEPVNGIPTVFTNAANHGTTVSGFFISASKTYPYSGHSSSLGNYSSTGMRLYGLESTNNTAEKTSKVAHGAPYNSDTRSGSSAGCPAMTKDNAATLMKNLTGGILWYHYTKINKSASYKSPSCNSSVLAHN